MCVCVRVCRMRPSVSGCFPALCESGGNLCSGLHEHSTPIRLLPGHFDVAVVSQQGVQVTASNRHLSSKYRKHHERAKLV